MSDRQVLHLSRLQRHASSLNAACTSRRSGTSGKPTSCWPKRKSLTRMRSRMCCGNTMPDARPMLGCKISRIRSREGSAADHARACADVEATVPGPSGLVARALQGAHQARLVHRELFERLALEARHDGCDEPTRRAHLKDHSHAGNSLTRPNSGRIVVSRGG